MEVIGRRDEEGVDFFVPQQILDVVEHVADPESLGQRPCLGDVDVADGRQFDVLEFLEHRQMRHLHDSAGANQADADGIAHDFLLNRCG